MLIYPGTSKWRLCFKLSVRWFLTFQKYQHALISYKAFRRMCYYQLNHGDTIIIVAVRVSAFRRIARGAYVYGLSVNPFPRDVILPLLDRSSEETCVEDSRDLLSIQTPLGRPGSVTYVSPRAGAYGRLLLATYERRQTSTLSACDWLTTVTQGVLRLAPSADAGGMDDAS